jgi:hypothetical protein
MAITLQQLEDYRKTDKRLKQEVENAKEVFRVTTNILLDNESAERLIYAAWKAERGIQ